MSAVGFSRTFRFTKDLTLEGSSLLVRYRVENIGAAAQSFLYACHPLFAVSAGDRILLPPEARELTLYYSRNNRLGERGAIVPWPVMTSGIHLDLIEGPERGTAEMFYTTPLKGGSCGIYRSATGQALEVSFDTASLPISWPLDLSWPDQGAGPRQYAVALESTTSWCGTLAEAQQIGSATELGTSDVAEWGIRFGIMTPG